MIRDSLFICTCIENYTSDLGNSFTQGEGLPVTDNAPVPPHDFSSQLRVLGDQFQGQLA